MQSVYRGMYMFFKKKNKSQNLFGATYSPKLWLQKDSLQLWYNWLNVVGIR